MIIDVDVGNTRVKWRFAGGEKPFHFCLSDRLPEQWKHLPQGARFRISSVIDHEQASDFYKRLAALGGVSVEVAVVQSPFAGISVAYRDVSSMGVDRWLALLAASRHRPATDCVVIHAGTALVADFLRANGEHLGGYIVGGWRASLCSLGDAAQALKPSLDRVTGPMRTGPGTTTLECVEAGVSLLFSGFLRELKCSASLHLQSPVWMFAGGDAEKMLDLYQDLGRKHWIEEHSVLGPELVPGLVLDGLAIALP